MTFEVAAKTAKLGDVVVRLASDTLYVSGSDKHVLVFPVKVHEGEVHCVRFVAMYFKEPMVNVVDVVELFPVICVESSDDRWRVEEVWDRLLLSFKRGLPGVLSDDDWLRAFELVVGEFELVTG